MRRDPLACDEMKIALAVGIAQPDGHRLDPDGHGQLAGHGLQAGGGLTIRAGYRSRFPWYVGGAYEFSRHDSSNLLILPILQQIRAEGRYYWDRGQRLLPYLAAGAGVVLYGSEWGVESGGAAALLGLGLEFQVTPALAIGGSISYRPMLFRRWTDSAGQLRADEVAGFGVAHLAALELAVELRNPLPRW